MDLRHLHHFVFVAELGTMTLAAERLSVTQPALSHQIKALERELGVTLFERTKNRLVLTPAGEELLRRSRGLLRQVEESRVAVTEIGSGLTGFVRVAAGMLTMYLIVAPAAVEFRELFPRSDVQFVEESYDIVVSLIERGDVDLAVGPFVPRLQGLAWEPLYTALGYILVPPQHRLASRDYVTVDDFVQNKLLLVKSGQGTHFVRDAIFHLYGVPPAAIFESARPETLLQLAEQQLGIAVVTDSVPFEGYDLRAVPILQAGRQVETTIGVSWQRDHPLSEAANQFIALLKAQAAARKTTGYHPWQPERSLAAG
jgi:DNA-binding transcriptional LysR family regulator